MICEICGKFLKNRDSLHQHLKQYHNYTQDMILNYDIKYLGFIIPKCPICGNNVKVHFGGGRLFTKTCGNTNCKRQLYKQKMEEYYNSHPEAREKHRKDRINYLKDKQNFEKTAWGIRANNKFTFLEQWFVDNILIPYKLGEKFDIINEYEIYPYFIDFCFLNNHVCVELDGRCHFNNGKDRVEHDIEKDNKLNELNWKVYHITYIDIEQNPEKTINDFIWFINQQEIVQEKRFDFSVYQKYKVIKQEKIELYLKRKQKILENKEKEFQKKRNYFIDLEQNSNIDFSKFGWVGNSLKYLKNTFDFEITNLQRAITKYYPEFFVNNKVFVRKGSTL